MSLPASAQLPNFAYPLNARQFDAEFMRMAHQCMAYGEGIAPFDHSKDCTIASMGANRATDLEVTTGGSGLNLSVAAGNAWVKGDSRTTQGLYFCHVDVAKTVTLAANSSGNPRIDALLLKVSDSDVSGTANGWEPIPQQGTATAGATLLNLAGAPGQAGGPALEGSALLLSYVLVPSGFTGPFVNATHILDQRYFAYRPNRTIGYVERTTNTNPNTVAVSADVCGNGVNRLRAEANFAAYANTAASLTGADIRSAGTAVKHGQINLATNERANQAPVARLGVVSGRRTIDLFCINQSFALLLASATDPTTLRVAYE